MAIDLWAIAAKTIGKPSGVDLWAIASSMNNTAPTAQPQNKIGIFGQFWSYLKDTAKSTVKSIFDPKMALQFARWVANVWNNISWFIDKWLWVSPDVAQKWKSFDETIDRTIVWDKFYDSKQAAIQRWAGEFAATTALTAPIWWAGLSLSKKAGAAIGSRLLWWVAGAWVWAVAWWASTQVGSIASRWELASGKETAIGAWIWWFFGGVAWYKSANAWEKLWDLITEVNSSKNLKIAADQWRLKFEQPWIFWQWWAKITSTERAAFAKKIIQNEIKWFSTKDPQKLINQVDSLGRQEYMRLSPELQKIPVGTMTKAKADLSKQVTNILKDSSWKKYFSSPTKEKQVSTLVADIKNAKSADDLWKARINLDKIMPESVKTPSQWNFQAETLNSVWIDIRSQMNDALDDIVKNYNNEWVKSSFYKMSSLLEAKNNIISNIPKLAKPWEAILKKKDLWKWIVGTAWLSIGWNLLLKDKWW